MYTSLPPKISGVSSPPQLGMYTVLRYILCLNGLILHLYICYFSPIKAKTITNIGKQKIIAKIGGSTIKVTTSVSIVIIELYMSFILFIVANKPLPN